MDLISVALGASPAQVALAWLLATRPNLVPIPGTRRIAYLEQNLGALKIEINAEQRAWLDRQFDSPGIQGQRYPDAGMAGIE